MDSSDDPVHFGVALPGSWPDPPGWVDGAPSSGIGQSCAFCGTRDVAWVHPLARDRRAYREYGQAHMLPGFWALCDPCETIYASGDDDAAVAAMRPHWSIAEEDVEQDVEEDVAERLRKPLVVFRRADLGARRLDPEPPRLVRAREQGFVPLREVTGVADTLGRLWPAEHRVWLDDLGPGPGEHLPGEVPERWLVRSPWPSLSVEQTLHVLWPWVERPPFPSEEQAWTTRVLEVFDWAESEALEALALLDSES